MDGAPPDSRLSRGPVRRLGTFLDEPGPDYIQPDNVTNAGVLGEPELPTVGRVHRLGDVSTTDSTLDSGAGGRRCGVRLAVVAQASVDHELRLVPLLVVYTVQNRAWVKPSSGD